MSFPPVYAPGNYSDPAAASCNGSRYQFYCDDSILPNAERLQQWYVREKSTSQRDGQRLSLSQKGT